MADTIVTKATLTADYWKNMVEVAKSNLVLEIEDFGTTEVPFTVSMTNIQLMKFSDASWSLAVEYKKKRGNEDECLYKCSSTLNISGFPEKLMPGAKVKLEFGGKFTSDFATSIIFENKFSVGRATKFSGGAILTILVPKSSKSSLAFNDVAATKALSRNMSTMLGNATFSDFTFIVKGEPFKVHKSILAAASAVWCKMFTADFNEKKTGTCNIDHVDPKIFRALLRFVYCAELPKKFGETMLDLYEAAHQYEIEPLKKICADQMKQELSAENAIKTLSIAQRYGIDVASEAWEVIQRDVLKTLFPTNAAVPTPQEINEIMAWREKENALIEKLKSKATLK